MRIRFMKGSALRWLAATAVSGACIIGVASPAHADCLMIGHPDLGSSPALLHNPASQGDCDGAFRMYGYIEDHASDDRTAVVYATGVRANGSTAWTRRATASGNGKVTHFDWTNSRVHHVRVSVWAENFWGSSTNYTTTYTGSRV